MKVIYNERVLRKHYFFFIIFLTLTIFFSVRGICEESVKWISFPDPAFEVNGLPWFTENSPDLYRLPKRLIDTFRKPVWNLAKSPSGGRIRFRSDCTTLAVRLKYPNLHRGRNMHTFGQSGVDLYLDGKYVRTAVPKDSTYVEFFYFKDIAKRMHEITIYLPLYKGVSVGSIGVNDDAEIKKPQPFVLNKPIVYYGTSITQGGCASRSGMSYQAIIGRRLNTDFVNLGFSGNGRGEAELAEAIVEIDAACYVLDFAVNNGTAESLKEVYGPFVDILRDKHPNTPIIAITPLFFTSEYIFYRDHRGNDKMRDVIRDEITKRMAAGDKKLTLVEGTDLIGPDLTDGYVDGVHPNDLGFQAMAERLIPTLVRVLGLAYEEPFIKW